MFSATDWYVSKEIENENIDWRLWVSEPRLYGQRAQSTFFFHIRITGAEKSKLFSPRSYQINDSSKFRMNCGQFSFYFWYLNWYCLWWKSRVSIWTFDCGPFCLSLSFSLALSLFVYLSCGHVHINCWFMRKSANSKYLIHEFGCFFPLFAVELETEGKIKCFPNNN